MLRFIAWIKEEVIKLLPAITFFVITFNLINFTQRLMPHMVPNTNALASYSTATFGALCAGKVVFIVSSLRFINAFSNKPLIYNIIWQFFIYAIAALLFRILEELLHAAYVHWDWHLAIQSTQVKLHHPGFWAIQLWVMMIFAVYIMASELTKVLGKDKVKQALFH